MQKVAAHTPDRIQRWMQAVIMHPDGPVAGMDSPLAREAIDVDTDRIEQVVCRSRNLTGVERLQIYSSAYLARLVECLREEYPAMVHLLGRETFDSFAVAYIQSHPSTSYTLSNLSQSFPSFLRETRPSDEEGGDGAADWIDFLIDLATVERTYSEVFDGPGLENSKSLSPDDLRLLPPEEWENARLLMNPSLRLLTLQFPAHEYISQVQKKKSPDIPAREPTHLVIFRRDFIVRRNPVSARESAILAPLRRGEALGAAIEHGLQLKDEEPVPDPAVLREWFRSWTVATYFRGIAAPVVC